jgi:hypothetical protein
MKKVSKKLVGAEFADAIGKTTVLALEWKDWEKELPESGDRVYIISKLEDGFYPVTGIYFDEIIPASGTFKKSRWQTVRIDDGPMVILGGEDANRLIAWAKPKRIGKVLNEDCIICKKVLCCC